MKYLFFLIIFLIPIGLASADSQTDTLTYSTNKYIRDTDNNNICDASGSYVASTSTWSFAYLVDTDDINTDCARTVGQWSIATIPDDAIILNVTLTVDVNATTSMGADTCDVYPLTNDVSSASNAALFTDAKDGAAYVSANTFCQAAGNNKVLILPAAARTALQNQLTTTDIFGLGFTANDETLDAASSHTSTADISGGAVPLPRLSVTWSYQPDAVDDLVITDTRATGVSIEWTQPNLNGGTLEGYMVNYTTPHGQPLTMLTPNPFAESIAATVSGLTGETQYSFRVGAVVTTGIGNITGANIANTTTLFDPTGTFSPGSFITNFTGTDVRTIKFERDDINATALWLNVTYPNTYNTTCNFYYKFALSNDTYTNLSDVAINANEDEASFLFIDVDNEVIDVLCWNDTPEDQAQFILVQTAFPFLEQIENFRNGTYGTAGQFGQLDFITLIAVIASMIGFNRVNETVGVIFGLFMLGALAVLSNGEIISWYSTFTVGFAVVIMWAIGTTRKD